MEDPPTHFFKFVPPGFLFNLSIPRSFLTNLPDKRFLKAILRRGRREWSVDIDDGVFGDGWRRFVREIGVQERDFIVFKHHGSMVFDFLVFDQSTCERQLYLFDENDGEEPLTESDTISTHGNNFIKNHFQVKETCSNQNNHPYFISNLKPTNLKKSVLYLPVDFSRQNGLRVGEMILRDNEGRSWKVYMNNYKDKSFYLGHGLRAFLAANNLKEGDAYKFELIEKEKDKPPIVNFLFLESKPNKYYKEARSLQKEGLILSEEGLSYFVGVLKACSIRQSILYLPIGFARSNGLIDNRKMILRNAEDDRSWTVEFKNSKNKHYYIGRGWDDFRVAYGLKEGDHFKFELVKNGEKRIIYFYLRKICQS